VWAVVAGWSATPIHSKDSSLVRMIKSKHQNHTHKIRLPFIGTAVVASGVEHNCNIE